MFSFAERRFNLKVVIIFQLPVMVLIFLCVIGVSCKNNVEPVTEVTIEQKFIIDGSLDLNNIFTPVDISIDSEGRVFILDMVQMMVIVLNTNGDFLYTFGGKGEAPGEFSFLSHNFDIDEYGNVYLIDYPGTIEIFSNEGLYLGAIEPSIGKIFDLAAIDSNRIYISGFPSVFSISEIDGIPAVMLLDRNGTILRKFGHIDLSHCSTAIEGLAERTATSACALDVDEDNSLYYSTTSDYQVFKYDSIGTLIWSVEGVCPYELQLEEHELGGYNMIPVVWDLDVSGNRVYVLWAQGADSRGNRVDVYNKDDGMLEFYFYTEVPVEKWNYSIDVYDDLVYVVDHDGAMIYCFSIPLV